MTAALVVGVACGLILASRWSILTTPAVYVAVFDQPDRFAEVMSGITSDTYASP